MAAAVADIPVHLFPIKLISPCPLQRGGQPPRDLAGLVEELVLAEAGQEPGWGTQFRSFLKQRSVLVTISVTMPCHYN